MDFGGVGWKQMVTAKIYIEGGGKGRALETWFCRGWNEFFAKAGVGACTKIVRCGGRQQAFDKFRVAVSGQRAGTIPLLLVDSEGAVAAEQSVWQHLEGRDSWKQPEGADEDQAFLMVQVMETWFLADKETLQKFFGQGFRDNAIRQWPNLEDVGKPTVLDALEHATAQCRKRYSKGKVSFELLARINPGRVEAVCPHAKELLQRLRDLGGTQLAP